MVSLQEEERYLQLHQQCKQFRRVGAPMVNQSDAPFRSLCLKYGATVTYTEMLYAGLIAASDSYLLHRLPPVDHTFCVAAGGVAASIAGSGGHQGWGCSYQTRPLVVQICGNDADILAQAARKIASTGLVDGIDLNLGCPQDRAREGLFGSYLLDKRHWPRVFACVGAMVDAVDGSVPIYCKIRLCEDGVDVYQCTLDFCRGLVCCGVKLICIHGRTRGSAKHRRAGAADLGMIGHLARALYPVPVVSNGNIVTRGDVAAAWCAASPCVGVMAAEGLLRDPAVFALHAQQENELDELRNDPPSLSHPHAGPAPTTVPALPRVPDRYSLFAEYCSLSEAYFAAGGWHRLAVGDAVFASASSGSSGIGSSSGGAGDSSRSGSSGAGSDGSSRRSDSGGGSSGGGTSSSCTRCDTATECGGESDGTEAGLATIAIATSGLTTSASTPTPAILSSVDDVSARRNQVDVARAHLLWMLDKSGHGRTVTFGHPGPYKKHTQLLTALKDSTSVDNLLSIAHTCLQGVHGSVPFIAPDDVKQNILYFNHYLPRV